MAETFYYVHPSDVVAVSALTAQIGTADAAYPLVNATDFSQAKIAAPSKLVEVTGAWQADLGSTKRVDLVVLWVNVDEALVIDVQMHASASWGAPTVNGHLTMPARRADGFARKVFLDLRAVSGYTTSGLRYLRINVAGTNSAPLGLKLLAFSRIRQLGVDFQWGVADDEQHLGIVMKTDAGVRWGYDLAAAPRGLKGSALLTDADAETVREWFRACAGVVKHTVIIPEPTVNDAWLVYWSPGGFAIESPSLTVARHSTTREYQDANATSLQFEELTAGDPEWF